MSLNPPFPPPWKEVSKGDVPCNHVGMVEQTTPTLRICINCTAAWVLR